MKTQIVRYSFALALLAAGCVSAPEEKKPEPVKAAAESVEPVIPKAVGDPNPFADYDLAMRPTKGLPMAVEWQKNNQALADATKIDALKALLKDRPTVDALLAQVKPDYATDPLVATEIAAASQLSMCRKWDGAPAARGLWTEALLDAAAKAPDAYRKMFFLDQIRWCGKSEQAGRVLTVGNKSGSRAVIDFAKLVATELKEAK